jgi:drug/metabolite transporter (DMT)-like permease
MSQQRVIANLSVLLAVVFFGAATVATRVAVQDVPPLDLALLRYGLGALLLLGVLLLVMPGSLRVRLVDLPFLFLLGAILYAWFPLTFNAGLELTEASRGALMLATLPLWSALLGALTGRESLSRRQLAGVFLTILGVGMVLGEQDIDWQAPWRALAGDALMILTAFAGALYGVLSKRALSRYSAVSVTVFAMSLGAILLLPPTVLLGDTSQTLGALGDTRVLLLVAFLATFAGALGWFLYSFGLVHLSPTQVAVYVNLNPVVATLLAVWLLGDRVTLPFALGFLGVIAGVLCVNWPAGSHKNGRPG